MKEWLKLLGLAVLVLVGSKIVGGIVSASSSDSEAVQASEPQSEGWINYRNEELGFAVELPGQPTASRDSMDGDIYQVYVDRIKYDAKYEFYVVTVVHPMNIMSHERAFDAEFARLQGGAGYGAVSRKDTTWNGFPAMRTVADLKSGVRQLSTFVFADRRLYTANAVIGGSGSMPYADRFLESFQVISQQ